MNQADPLHGTRYEVVSLLAQGNYGDIYRAQDRETLTSCLVKVLQERHLNSKTLDRFRIEAQTAWSLNSPHIMEAWDFGVSASGRPFYCMDDTAGETLSELLRREERLAAPDTLKLMKQLLLGVEAAHQVGIVHRDLCPDNIFLQQSSDTDWTVKILDFGLAKLREYQSLIPPSAIPTPDGEVVGKSDYASPEQEFPGYPADPRLDLYAIGIILYECVVGARPTWKDSSLNIPEELRRIGFPSTLGIPRSLEQVILQALSGSVDDRYQTAHDFFVALEQIE